MRRASPWSLAGPAVFALFLASAEARADDDLVLDLGGTTLATRHVTHGTFSQGSATGELGHDKDEEPPHPVTISKDYWIGKYPVTRSQFAKFVADTRYVTDAEKGVGGAAWDGKQLTQKKDASWHSPGFTQTDEHPVVMVSFGDATAFVGWASRKSGKRVRLPTEAEWEYAARGGSTTTPWYGGTTEAEALTLGYFKPNAGNGTRPVGQKKPNMLGVFDMAGNVFEWCRDFYGPYKEGAATDPEVTTKPGFEAERRVLRGGSWLRDPKRGRSASRWRNPPGSRNADNGFRVVVTLEETVAPGLGAPPLDFAGTGPVGVSGAASGAPSPSAGLAVGGAGARRDDSGLPVAAPAPPSEALSLGLMIASPIAAASAVVAWMLLRRKRRPYTSEYPPPISVRGSTASFPDRASANIPAAGRLPSIPNQSVPNLPIMPVSVPRAKAMAPILTPQDLIPPAPTSSTRPMPPAPPSSHPSYPSQGPMLPALPASSSHPIASSPPSSSRSGPPPVPSSTRSAPPPLPARTSAPPLPAAAKQDVPFIEPEDSEPVIAAATAAKSEALKPKAPQAPKVPVTKEEDDEEDEAPKTEVEPPKTEAEPPKTEAEPPKAEPPKAEPPKPEPPKPEETKTEEKKDEPAPSSSMGSITAAILDAAKPDDTPPPSMAQIAAAMRVEPPSSPSLSDQAAKKTEEPSKPTKDLLEKAPADGWPKAQLEDEKPKADDEKPKADEEKPKTDEEKPKTDEEKPKTDEEKPKTDEEKPKADAD